MDEDDKNHGRGNRRTGQNNPFAAEMKKHKKNVAPAAVKEEGEVDNDDNDGGDDDVDGEDDYDEEDDGEGGDDGGEDMDSDDEGDNPYPEWEKSSTTVACELCGEYVPKTEIATHEKMVCSESPMECPFAAYHCGATALNRRLLARASESQPGGSHRVDHSAAGGAASDHPEIAAHGGHTHRTAEQWQQPASAVSGWCRPHAEIEHAIVGQQETVFRRFIIRFTPLAVVEATSMAVRRAST